MNEYLIICTEVYHTMNTNYMKLFVVFALLFCFLNCETYENNSRESLLSKIDTETIFDNKDSLIIYCNTYSNQSELTVLSCDTFILETGKKVEASTIVNYYLTDSLPSLMIKENDLKIRDTIDSELTVKTITVFNSVYMVIEHNNKGVVYICEFIDFTKHEIYLSKHPYLDSAYLDSKKELFSDYFDTIYKKMNPPLNVIKSE